MARSGVRLAWLVVLAAGCWTGGQARPSTPSRGDRPAPRDAYPAHSTWRGLYRCSQGLTAVTLTLDASPRGFVKAVFDFGPTDDNPTVPTGSYKLTGSIKPGPEGTFEIALEPLEWISGPDGYVMVPLSAISSRRWRRLVGRIDHPSCGELDVRRAD